MKLIRSTCKALGAALVLAAAVMPASAAANDRYEEFKKKFRQAMTINEKAELAKLVKLYQPEAVIHTDVLCSQIPRGTSDELEREIDSLNRAWQDSLKTKFVEKHYTYLSLISPQNYKERSRLQAIYRDQLNKFIANLGGDRDGPTFELVAGEMKMLGRAFEELGDLYLAGEAWMNYGMSYQKEYRGKDGDPRLVVEGYSKMIELWDRIGLQYKQYFSIKTTYDALIAEGWGETLNDPDAPAPGAPVEAANATVLSLNLTFEAIPRLDSFERPNYFLDEMYQVWPSLYLLGKGASAAFSSMKQGPLVVRESSSGLSVDFNRDGTGQAELKLTGRMTVVECDLVDDGPPRKWAFLAATGIQEDAFQGLKVNLQPDDNQMSLYYVSAASVVGTLGETPIRIIDDNMDGAYGSAPVALGYMGLSEGHFQPEMDSIVIGTSKRALPWSELTQVGGQWYRLESVDKGVRMAATPMDVKTGKLKLEFKGPPILWLVVQGEDSLESCYYDLRANGKAAVEVPIGIYSLYAGEVLKGKKQQVMKALILPGEKTPTWHVKEGEETVVELGAPFGFDFKVSQGEESVTVHGASVTIVGSADERYERTWNCAPRPEASARKPGSKRGSKGQKLALVDDLQLVREGKLVYAPQDAWRPLDTQVEVKAADEPYEVQLVEKKNKLFGKIESEWR